MILPHNHTVSPWGHFAGLVQRTKDLVVIQIIDDPSADGYRVLWGASPDDLYGNPAGSGVGGAGGTALFSVTKGKMYRSRSVVQAGLTPSITNRRGQTWAMFDLRDWPALPSSESFFLGVQQIRNGNVLQAPGGANVGYDILGPSLLIPSAQALGMSEATVLVSGTATDLTVAYGSTPGSFRRDLDGPNGPMMGVVMPRPTTSITVRNTDAVGGDNLAVSFGVGQPYVEVVPASEITTFGAVKEIYVASGTGGGNPGYQIVANLGLGAMGGV